MSDNFYLKEKAFTALKLNLTAPILKKRFDFGNILAFKRGY